jgi:microcystin-dependent protein
MSESYVGEIRMFAGNFAPAGWALCNGQLIAIANNETLFNLIGTTYGGDGQQTFGLPDLRGRVPIHFGTLPGGGSTYVQGQIAGTETVSLNTNTIPAHNHSLFASETAAGQAGATNAFLAQTTTPAYFAAPAVAPMSASAIALSGGGQPHDNLMPFLCVSFIISLFGIFPSRN